MIVRRLFNYPILYPKRLASNAASLKQTSGGTFDQKEPKKWEISVGLALLRSPIIAPEMTEVERKYDNVARDIEHENSLMSNFELRVIKDKELLLKRQKLEEEGKDLSQLNEEIGITAVQKEDEWARNEEAVIKEYNLDDIRSGQINDPKSLRSKIDRKLVLMVKQQFGTLLSPWILPQLSNSGETLRQTVERCLGETFTSDINVSISGNAPMSVHRSTYPKPLAQKTGFDGNLIFIYTAYINELDRELKFNNAIIKDYMWCSSDDLDTLFENKHRAYKRKIRTLLFE